MNGGLPLQIDYPNQQTMSLSYDAQWRLTGIAEQSDGKRRLKLAYSDDGKRLISISDGLPEPRRVTFEYDPPGRLTGVTNRLGNVTHYTYAGETAHLHEIVDARGHTALALEYDADGRVTRQQNTRSLQEGKSTRLATSSRSWGRPAALASSSTTTVTAWSGFRTGPAPPGAMSTTSAFTWQKQP
jgi:YD repeat-containing protein